MCRFCKKALRSLRKSLRACNILEGDEDGKNEKNGDLMGAQYCSISSISTFVRLVREKQRAACGLRGLGLG
jgi:hypothetical protein